MTEEISDGDSVVGSHLSHRNLEINKNRRKSRKLSILSIDSEKLSSKEPKFLKTPNAPKIVINTDQTELKSVVEGIL